MVGFLFLFLFLFLLDAGVGCIEGLNLIYYALLYYMLEHHDDG